MTVATKKVQGRRTVRYASLSELLSDAEQLSAMKTRTLGNWSFGQILKHIAMSLDSSIDGAGFALPVPARWLMSLLMKRKFLTKHPAGLQDSGQVRSGRDLDRRRVGDVTHCHRSAES